MKKELLDKYGYKKKKSLLTPYIEDIRTLLEHDATQVSILAYLKNEKDITVSQPYLSNFIRKFVKTNKESTTVQNTIKEHTPKNEKLEPVAESKGKIPKTVDNGFKDEITVDTHDFTEEELATLKAEAKEMNLDFNQYLLMNDITKKRK